MPHALRIHRHGGPESFVWEEIVLSDPGPGEARVRHTAVGLNYIDIYMRTGLYPAPAMPAILGCEAAGVVEAVGPGVAEVAVGDRVGYCSAPIGAYCEARNYPAERLIRLPDTLDDRTAAAAMLQGMTAHFLIFQTYAVQPGDRILVHAAAGGVGLILCAWAAHRRATVIGAVSTAEKARLAQAHGCAHVLIYGQDDVASGVRALTAGEGVSVVYDSVGRDTFESSLDCLRPRGMLALYGQASGAVPPFDLARLGQKGSLFVTRPSLAAYTAGRADLEEAATALFDAIRDGIVRININQSFALRDAAAAHRALEGRRTTGSTVLIA